MMTHESGSLLSSVELNILVSGSTAKKVNFRGSLNLGHPDSPLNSRWPMCEELISRMLCWDGSASVRSVSIFKVKA